MNVYKDLDVMTQVALHNAKDHRCNYNVIILNPVNDEFDIETSTYEFVADSYFEKERPNAKLLFTTDELLLQEQVDKTETDEYKAARSPFDPEPFMIHNTYKETYLDFVNEYAHYGSLRHSSHPPFVREGRKISNNEKCTCGSNKKYKKCCK